MKKSIMVFILAIVLGLSFAGLAQSQKSQGIISEVELLVPNQKPMTQISYIEGTNSRTEMYQGTGPSKVLTHINILKGEVMYMLMPEQKMAMKMNVKAQAGQGKGDKKSESPKCEKWEECLKLMTDMEVTNRGKQKWEGKEYTVYRATEKTSRNYVDYYVDDKGMLKRWLSYDAKGTLQAEMRMIKFEAGKPLPAGIFDIPSGYQIMDMSQMPGTPH